MKINHRKLLDGLLSVCGVPNNKVNAICSAIDKLDKADWSEVRQEMISEKGLEPSVADKIGTYVQRKGKFGSSANPFSQSCSVFDAFRRF